MSSREPELFSPGAGSDEQGGPPAGVTAALGFRAAGVPCGIRRGRPDLALMVSDLPATAAAVYTRNRVRAAPLEICRQNLELSGGAARAVVVNSGNANACTGAAGLAAARTMGAETARCLQVPEEQVLVASTGVIGQPLPVEKIVAGIPQAVRALSPSGGSAAAEAILTTDTRTKQAVRWLEVGGRRVTLGGMAKGSGMVHPDMATTLAFVGCDGEVAPELLRDALGAATELSFNRVTVDGDTSTNDMIAALCNGASGARVATAEAGRFTAALTELLVDLARQVAADGEGAGRLITVEVTGARSDAEAAVVARTIASSPLVKTAVHGADANWGRIVAAAGRAGIEVTPEAMSVSLGGLAVLEPGLRSSYSEQQASELMSGDEVVIGLDLGCGQGRATAWGCDLSAEYVRINASYRS